MRPHRRAWLPAALALAAAALGACDRDRGILTVELVASPDPLDEPLAGVAQTLRITVSGPSGRSGPLEVPVREGRARLPGVPVGDGQTLTVEGLGPDGNVVSRGRSGPWRVAAGEQTLALYLGRLERFGLVAATGSGKRRGMVEARAFHAATLLADGSLLLTGGATAPWRPEQGARPTTTASVERLDGSGLRFSDASPCDAPRGCLRQPRLGHSATAVPDSDTVLVAGGIGSSETADAAASRSTELYSAGERAFFEGPALATARADHAAVAHAPGQVLLAGGRGDASLTALVELYRGGAFSQLPRLLAARRNFALALLADGTLVASGGLDEQGAPLASSELLRPAAPQWAPGPNLQLARAFHTATALPDGTVLLVGGLSTGGLATGAVERLDPQRSERVAELSTPRWAHSTSLLQDGRLLVVGGFAVNRNGSPSSSFEELTVAERGTVNLRARCCLRVARAGHSATVLSSGWLLVAGGLTESPGGGPSGSGATPQVSDTAEVFVY